MKRDGRQVELEQLHILHNQCIDASIPTVVDQLSGTLQLIFVKQSVQRHIHLGIIQGRMAAEAFNVLDAIASLLAGAEVGATDINGIGTMVDGGYAYLGVLGG